MISNAMRETGGEHDFLGYLSQMDFVLITSPKAVVALKERVYRRLNNSLDYFYPIKEHERSFTGRKYLLIKLDIHQSSDCSFDFSEKFRSHHLHQSK